MADPYLYPDLRFNPEFKDKPRDHIMHEQLFLISMTTGDTFESLLNLNDRHRNWLYNRCAEYQKKRQEEEKKASKGGTNKKPPSLKSKA